jgi:hypothetical protein
MKVNLFPKKYFSTTFKNKFKLNSKLFIPDTQTYAVSEKSENSNENNINVLDIKSIRLNEAKMFNLKEKKLLIYYPYFLNLGEKKNDTILNKKINELTKKYDVKNVLFLGSMENKYLEKYFQNKNDLNFEFMMFDSIKFGELHKIFGNSEICLVLDDTNKIIFSDKHLFIKRLIAFFGWTFLFLFNFLYLPIVDDIVNKV